MFGIDDAIAAGLKILDKFVPDPQAREEAEKALRDSLQAWDGQQAAVNAAEAQSSSLFVAGWRPAVGWICAAGFAWKYIGLPLGEFISVAAGYPVVLPSLETGELISLLFGMLGMSGLRTYEKIKDVAR